MSQACWLQALQVANRRGDMTRKRHCHFTPLTTGRCVTVAHPTVGSALEKGLYWGGGHAAVPPPAGAGDKLVMVHGVACVYGVQYSFLFTLYHVAVANQSRTNQANLIPYKFRYKCDKGVLSHTFASRTH